MENLTNIALIVLILYIINRSLHQYVLLNKYKNVLELLNIFLGRSTEFLEKNADKIGNKGRTCCVYSN